VLLIDSGAESAAALTRYLSENDLLCGCSHQKNVTYYTSGDERVFASVAEVFLGENIAASVRGVVPFSL
jgi:glutamate racemase